MYTQLPFSTCTLSVSITCLAIFAGLGGLHLGLERGGLGLLGLGRQHRSPVLLGPGFLLGLLHRLQRAGPGPVQGLARLVRRTSSSRTSQRKSGSVSTSPMNCWMACRHAARSWPGS